MKKIVFNKGRLAAFVATVLMFGLPCVITSCKEDVSDEAFKVKTQPTLIDQITSIDSLSLIKQVFDRAKLGRSANASVLTSVLSARGNYTVFAPSDRALQFYIDSVTSKTGATVEDLDSAQLARIALNCVIDNGTDDAYETPDFPTDNSTFATSNLNDRRLSSRLVNGSDYYINNNAKVELSYAEDISNGALHIVSAVIAPSELNLYTLVELNPEMKIMAHLLSATGWDTELALHQEEEEEYETANLSYAGTTHIYQTDGNISAPYQEKRYINYTAFIETDDVFKNDWGIDIADTTEIGWVGVVAKINQKCAEIMGETATDDYTSAESPLNKFVAYHLVDGGMDSKEFVQHFNEWGYKYGSDVKNPQPDNYTVNVWDYYTTMGKGDFRGLLKITQLPNGEHDFYLNRISTYDDEISSTTYAETGYTENTPENGLNIKINISDVGSDNNALNGFYFPIEHVLVYGPETRTALASERIRMDMTTMLPELRANDLRGRHTRYFPREYFTNILNESQNTYVHYLMMGQDNNGYNWKDFQGDEFLVTGRYDFILKLPPVPKDGTYELRMGTSNNSLRSMVQVYLGNSPTNTTPVSLPIDQRESVDLILPGIDNVNEWWECEDVDDATIRERDRILRNQGYMKAAKYFTLCDGTAATNCRDMSGNSSYGPAVRRILTTAYFEANKTYYLRFKSVLENDNAQLMLDYFEFVPQSIANGAKAEDVW